MKKYWIIVDGKPQGPFTSSELKMRGDFTAELPVWCNELPNWTTVGQLPELACLLQPTDEAIQSEQFGSRQQEPEQSSYNGWIPQSAMAAAVVSGEKPPKTFIGWNLFMLFCCCLIGGVIGLIFGSQVNSRWQRGDVEGAKKASEIAEWCVIISIVAGLISWPFQLIFI